MCLSATDVAWADEAKATVSDAVVYDTASEAFELTVALSGCKKADTLAVSVNYDSAILKLDAENSGWLKESTVKGFDTIKNKGVWGVKEAVDVNGQIFKLAFTVNENVLFDKTKVSCTVTVKNDTEVIGTYTAEGIVELKCDHTFGAWTNKDAANHAQTCSKCKAENLEAHKWNEGVVTKEATATEAGKKVYTCSVCSATKEEEIPATGTPQQPGDSETPDDTQKPDSPETPDDTQKPGSSETPDDTQKPDSSETPGDTQKPGSSETPDDSQKPGDSETPDDSETPGSSETPSKPQTPSGSGDADNESNEGGSEDEDTSAASGVELDTMIVNNAIQEIKDAEAGTELVIEMKNSDGTIATVVPVKILQAISGKDVDVVLDMGDYSWVINGQNVTASGLKDINLEVLLDSKAIAADVVNEVANGDETVQITLQHNGEFGFEASLKLNVGKEHAGQYGNLYYYNNGALEFVNAAQVDANGDVSLVFTHASDYVIVLGTERTADSVVTEPETEEPADTDVNTNNTGTKEPADGGNGFVIVIVILVVIAAAVLAVVAKKKVK